MELTFLLKLTAVCNAGIYVESGDTGILIDGIASDYLAFHGLPADLFGQALRREGLFQNLKAVCFTHTHPDHCDPVRLQQLREAQPDLTILLPDEQTPTEGRIRCGAFSVLYRETPHMPHTYTQVRHFVLELEAAGESVYIAADAVIDAGLHKTFLNGKAPAGMVINPVYLTVPAMVELLRTVSPGQIIVYHLPVDAEDQTGMRRKAERSVARVRDSLPPITLVSNFPQRLL